MADAAVTPAVVADLPASAADVAVMLAADVAARPASAADVAVMLAVDGAERPASAVDVVGHPPAEVIVAAAVATRRRS